MGFGPQNIDIESSFSKPTRQLQACTKISRNIYVLHAQQPTPRQNSNLV